jgi:hypothetical protein
MKTWDSIQMDEELTKEFNEYTKKNKLNPVRFVVGFDEKGDQLTAWAPEGIFIKETSVPTEMPKGGKLIHQSTMFLEVYELPGGETYVYWGRPPIYWYASVDELKPLSLEKRRKSGRDPSPLAVFSSPKRKRSK